MTRKITVRFDLDPMAEARLSGVGGQSRRLAEAIANHPQIDLEGFYFNFRNSRHQPQTTITNYRTLNFPLKLYAKLASYGLNFPFDWRMPPVDATFFPNFVTWKTSRSTLSVTTIHDLTFLYFPELVEAKNLAHLKRVVPRSLKQADLIITVSEAIKAEIVKEYATDPDKILVVPIAVSELFRNFDPKQTSVQLPSALQNHKYISFVGNFEPRKNLTTLVEAYCKLPASLRQEYKLVIAGSQNWNNQAAQQLIDQLNQTDQQPVILQVSGLSDQEIANLMFHSSLHIMPSLYEGFGMPIVEAMTVDTPVIASDIPVLHESSGESAVYFNPHSVDDLAAKIQLVLNDPQLQHQLIAKGKKFSASLSWAKNADRVYQKLCELLDKK